MKDAELFYQVMSQIWEPAADEQVGGVVMALVGHTERMYINSRNLFEVLQALWKDEASLAIRPQDCEDNQAAYDLVFTDGSRLIAIAVDGIGIRLETFR